MAEEKSEKAVSRWDPFEELGLLRGWSPLRELSWPRLPRASKDFGPRARQGEWMPPVDIAEDDDQYRVSVEIAGATKDDVTVEADENVLTIRGEKRSEREEKKEQVRWVERSYGSFSRSFTLPPNADTRSVSANFRDGVLSIAIPKREDTKPKVINIKA